MIFSDGERKKELDRREARKKWTVKKLREELTRLDIGYMSNWTKPVLIKRLEEHDVILDRIANQEDAMRSFEEQLVMAEEEFERLGEEIENLAIQKNNLAREKAHVHNKIVKLKGVIELTKPSF